MGAQEAVTDARAVVDYGPAWPELFAALGRDLRAALAEVALRMTTSARPRFPASPLIADRRRADLGGLV
jgi:hypothetical protein